MFQAYLHGSVPSPFVLFPSKGKGASGSWADPTLCPESELLGLVWNSPGILCRVIAAFKMDNGYRWGNLSYGQDYAMSYFIVMAF